MSMADLLMLETSCDNVCICSGHSDHLRQSHHICQQYTRHKSIKTKKMENKGGRCQETEDKWTFALVLQWNETSCFSFTSCSCYVLCWLFLCNLMIYMIIMCPASCYHLADHLTMSLCLMSATSR